MKKNKWPYLISEIFLLFFNLALFLSFSLHFFFTFMHFSVEEIDWLIVQLLELKNFIEKNAQMPGSSIGQGKNDNAQQQVSLNRSLEFHH